MLFMIIERFKGGSPNAVGERFRTRGRLIPDDPSFPPLNYVASWMAHDGTHCFQVMEIDAPREGQARAALEAWMSNWTDLVDFEVTRVLTSKDFWAVRG